MSENQMLDDNWRRYVTGLIEREKLNTIDTVIAEGENFCVFSTPFDNDCVCLKLTGENIEFQFSTKKIIVKIPLTVFESIRKSNFVPPA